MKLPPIPPSIGIGLTWKNSDNGHSMVSVAEGDYHWRDGKRIARLELSNLLYSAGASHYYAKIRGGAPSCKDTVTGEQWGGSSRGGPDDHLGSLHIEVRRRLTKVEKDMSGEVIGKVGDLTYRFNSEAESKAVGIKVFKRRFAHGWVLVCQNEEGEDEIIAET